MKAITSRLRRNFGFLFSFSGRTLFVILCVPLCALAQHTAVPVRSDACRV